MGLGPKQRYFNREGLAWLGSFHKSDRLGDRVGRLIHLHQHFIWEFKTQFELKTDKHPLMELCKCICVFDFWAS